MAPRREEAEAGPSRRLLKVRAQIKRYHHTPMAEVALLPKAIAQPE